MMPSRVRKRALPASSGSRASASAGIAGAAHIPVFPVKRNRAGRRNVSAPPGIGAAPRDGSERLGLARKRLMDLMLRVGYARGCR